MTRVLVVDDDPSIRRTLGIGLRAHGYDVLAVATGAAALETVEESPPDLVVLDLGLPDLSGTEVLRRVRGWNRVPVIVLSAREASEAKVEALDLGADDYVVKPFGMEELLARLRAAVRRAGDESASRTVQTPHFRVDLVARQVWREGAEVRLTPIEWGLLQALATRPGQLIAQRRLLHEVWGPTYGDDAHLLRVHLANLRRKLEPDPSRPRYLVTEPGLGYRWVG